VVDQPGGEQIGRSRRTVGACRRLRPTRRPWPPLAGPAPGRDPPPAL